MTPAKSVGADGDGSKYLRARGMGSDGAADRSRVEQFAGFILQNVLEPRRKLMEATVCADAASFLPFEGVKL